MENEIKISFLVPARNASSFLEHTIETIHRFLSSRLEKQFEILIIPNGNDDAEYAQTLQIAKNLAQKISDVKVCPHDFSQMGKGAALRTGFNASRGQWIFFTDADLPYDLEFFDQALKSIQDGYEFITGNRRTLTSNFTLPVSILPFVYLRHILGLIFNITVRRLYGIHSHDTQAGIKAISRPLAAQAFARQSCPGFLFDIEFFLVAERQGFRMIELPVHLHMKDEQTTIKFAREALSCLYWLPKIAYKKFRGDYDLDRK